MLLKALEVDGFVKRFKNTDYNSGYISAIDDVDQVLINFDNHTTESGKIDCWNLYRV
jgi:hypothetical protein